MTLLIDYLEEAAAQLREKTEKLKKLEDQYRKIYDRDIVHEMNEIREEIKKKSSAVKSELFLNLEEFRMLHKYFPDLLQAFMEDEYIGRILSSKAWLLEFKPFPAQEAAARLQTLRQQRAQLRDALYFLKGWIGTVHVRSFVATYPILRDHMEKDMEKDELLLLIRELDSKLRKEGWSLLISDSLIRIPVAKFMNQISMLRYEESAAQAESKRMKGKGTIAEVRAIEKLRKASKRRAHYENVLAQLLLANPTFLNSIKKRKNWLSRDKEAGIERFAHLITPRSVKERAWLNEMKKRLSASGK